jgi:hypothetical protein
MNATTTNIVNLSTGALNGRDDNSGAPNNAPYYLQWAIDFSRIELVDSLTGLVTSKLDLLPRIDAAANQAALSGPTYTSLPVGAQVLVQDWNATGFGVIIQKKANSTGTFADWIVVSTGTKASTGDIGTNPL